jgi:hypothetical protein
VISKEDALAIGREKYPDQLGFAALYAEGYYDAVLACEESEQAVSEDGW